MRCKFRHARRLPATQSTVKRSSAAGASFTRRKVGTDCADKTPWEVSLPDLKSRLGGSLQLAIGEPDDAMAALLIEALAEARSLSLAEGATEYLVPRTRRSFADIEALVATIDRISLERAAPATMSVWRAALEALHGPPQAKLL